MSSLPSFFYSQKFDRIALACGSFFMAALSVALLVIMSSVAADSYYLEAGTTGWWRFGVGSFAIASFFVTTAVLSILLKSRDGSRWLFRFAATAALVGTATFLLGIAIFGF